MKTAVIFGDSIIGVDADDTGGLGQSAPALLESLGVRVLEVVGVQGSRAGNWLYAAGRTEGPGRRGGRWSGQGRKLDAQARQRASIPRLLSLNPDVVWINLGSNDAIVGLGADKIVFNALEIISMIPRSTRVIWTLGNVTNDRNHESIKRRLASQLARNAPDNVRVFDAAGQGSPYPGRGLHPPTSVHRQWLAQHKEAIAAHIEGQGRSDDTALVLGAIAGGAIAALTYYKLRGAR